MQYTISDKALAAAAVMVTKARLDETPEQYVTKRIDMLLQTWIDEIRSDQISARVRAEIEKP